MAEIKSSQIMVNMEPTLYDLVEHLAIQLNMSNSGYLRSLVIKDMIERGLLTQKAMTTLLMGRAS